MALRHVFSALSMSASVDQQTGSLSVFDVIEEIRAPQLPVHLQSMVISMVLEKTNGAQVQSKVWIHALSPDGQQKLIGSGELQVPAERKRIKAVFRFSGFPVASFGSHRVVVSWSDMTGKKFGESIFDFDVIQVTHVAQAGLPEGGAGGTTQH